MRTSLKIYFLIFIFFIFSTYNSKYSEKRFSFFFPIKEILIFNNSATNLVKLKSDLNFLINTSLFFLNEEKILAIISNHQSPDVIISGSQSFCTDGITTIDAGDFTSYVWAPNGEMTRTIDVDTEGTYSVTITDENGCTDTAEITINVITAETIK